MDADELQVTWRRIVTDHHLDVPQLLWASAEIIRLRNRIRELDQALSDAEHQLANPGN